MRRAPLIEGNVYGVILNDLDALASLADAMTKPPYLAAPQHPVLYIKPRNTLSAHGDTVTLPHGATEVEVGGTLGMVMGAPTYRVTEGEALERVKGFTVVSDLSLPHANLLRPPIRERCFDGACPIGPLIVDRGDIADPDGLEIVTSVNGDIVQRRSLRRLLRPLARLIAAVSEFMTLRAGDVLLAGVAIGGPRARAGDAIDVEIPGIGRLSNRIAGAAP